MLFDAIHSSPCQQVKPSVLFLRYRQDLAGVVASRAALHSCLYLSMLYKHASSSHQSEFTETHVANH